MLKKCLLILLCFFAIASLSGCNHSVLPMRGEIDEYAIMRVVGIDRSTEDPSKMEITLVTEKTKPQSSTSGMGGGVKEYDIISESGSTLFEAQRKVKSHTDKSQFFGYVDYFIFGEDAAKEDFGKYFDFVARDHEIRLSPKIYISKNTTAKEFLNQTISESNFIVDRLENIKADIGGLSNFGEVKIYQVMNMLDNHKNSAIVIPALMSVDIKDEKLIGGELPEKDPAIGGYAVLKDFKLVGYIDDSISRGYNFLVSSVKSAPISVEYNTSEYISLEIINQKTEVVARFNGDKLEEITYKSHVYSNISEVHTRTNIFKESEINKINSSLSEIVKNEMEQVISSSKEFGIDCTKLGEAIRMKHPIKWQKIKDDWDKIYPNLKINVVVSSDIRRTYDIQKTN